MQIENINQLFSKGNAAHINDADVKDFKDLDYKDKAELIETLKSLRLNAAQTLKKAEDRANELLKEGKDEKAVRIEIKDLLDEAYEAAEEFNSLTGNINLLIDKKEAQVNPKPEPSSGGGGSSSSSLSTYIPPKTYSLAEDDLNAIQALVYEKITEWESIHKDGFKEFIDAYFQAKPGEAKKKEIDPILEIITKVGALEIGSKDEDIDEIVANINQVLDPSDKFKEKVNDILVNEEPKPTISSRFFSIFIPKNPDLEFVLILNSQKETLETGLKNLKDLLDKEVEKIKEFEK